MNIKPHETKILEAFYHLYYLTAQQVTEYIYGSRGNYHTVSKTLLHLANPTDSYLFRGKPFDDKLMTVPYVYFLATKGRNHLETKGYDFSSWQYPSQMKQFIKSSHLPHCLGVNDFLILAERFVKQYPQIKISSLLHDFSLKRILQTPVQPDAYIKFMLPPDADSPRGYESSIWLEYDNATEKQDAFKSKIKRIIELMYSGFSDAFSSPLEAFTIAVVATTEEREHRLLLWAQEQLAEMNQEQLGGKFLFYSLPDRPDAKEVFLGRVWSIPFEDGKCSLLEI